MPASWDGDLVRGILLVEPEHVIGAALRVIMTEIMAEAVEAPDAVARDPDRAAVAAAPRAGQAVGEVGAVIAAGRRISRGEPIGPAERVPEIFEPDAVRMGDPGAQRGGVVFEGQCPLDPVRVRRGQDEPAEPVILIGDAGPGGAVEPGVELQVAKIVAVIDVAGLGGGEAGALRHDLDDQPVEIVVAVAERRAVALPEGRSVAGGVVAILLVIGGIDAPRARQRRGLGRVVIGRRPGRRGEGPAVLAAVAVIAQFRAVAVAVEHGRDLAVQVEGPGRLGRLVARADALAQLHALAGGVVEVAGDPVGAVAAGRAGRAGRSGRRGEQGRVHPDRGAIEPAEGVVAILGERPDRAGGALVADQRLICARAGDVTALQRVRIVIFGDQCVAVPEHPGHRGAGLLVHPPRRGSVKPEIAARKPIVGRTSKARSLRKSARLGPAESII